MTIVNICCKDIIEFIKFIFGDNSNYKSKNNKIQSHSNKKNTQYPTNMNNIDTDWINLSV